MLEGRDQELAWLAERLGRLRDGGHFVALVRGEAGVGKSALVEAALGDVAGVAVLRARGYESEREIPFAGLLELATPLLDLRDRLPEAQRRALGSALALEPPSPHDRFAVPVALLGLLAHAAEDGPLIAAVDDVHWFDAASREALLFVARRLAAEGVGLLLASRDAGSAAFDAAGVETLALSGLDAPSARRLLATRSPGLSPTVADALVTATAGNPLALVELPGELDAAQRAGRTPLADPLPTSAAIERAFAHQIAGQPAATQRALTVAAAMSRGRVEAFVAAARALDLPGDALAPAERSGVVRVEAGDGRIAFRHPLLRAAAYHAATSDQRRAAHAALAGVVDDPRRRAWHLAHAAAEAEETVAATLEDAARDARARGGHAEAARAFARAAELSDTPGARARRALAAAQDSAIAGQAERALALLDVAEPLVEGRLRAATARLRGNLALRRGELARAQRILEGAAELAAAEDDHVTVAALLLESSVSYAMASDQPGMRALLERASAAARIAGEPGQTIVRIMAAVAATVAGEAATSGAELAAIEPRLAELPLVEVGEPVALMAHALIWVGDLDRAERVIELLVGAQREASAVGALPYPLTVRSVLCERLGRWPQALADAEEGVRFAEDVGHTTLRPLCLAALARVEAGRGELETAERHAEAGLAEAEAGGGRSACVYNLAALGRAALAGDRPDDAAAILDRAAALGERIEWREPNLALDAADHVEALARLGRTEDAAAVLDRLTAAAHRTGGAWAHAAAARGRLLLSNDPDAQDEHARTAREWHERDRMPFERARTELAWGERLRRRRQRMRAREPLARAHATFHGLGAAPWAARALHELEAAGGVAAAGAREPRPDDALSAHERKVALMVADGMTNREVAAALFLSPKTIERHLSQIYRTLDVRSRTELARLMTSEPSAAAGAGTSMLRLA